MSTKFYIADDDIAILNILTKIVETNELGEVIGTAEDGTKAVFEIDELQPDIVLIDLLMPGKDGIEAMHDLKERGCEAAFIMVTQVDSEKMVSRAYSEGVEFYINKPLNVVEVVSLIKSVEKKQNMSKVIRTFESALKSMNIESKPLERRVRAASDIRAAMRKELAQLGILGEAGCQDIIEVVLWIVNKGDTAGSDGYNYKLSNAYEFVAEKYGPEKGVKRNTGAVEQRIRRGIKCAMRNVANLGIEDYYDDTFVKYASTLFDFGEVRKEMDFERGKTNYGGKTNVKKFIEGLIVILTNNYK